MSSPRTPLLTVLLAACAASAFADIVPLAERVSWPGMATVLKHEELYLSSTPSQEGFEYAQVQGVTTVLNLLERSESAWGFWKETLWGRFLQQQFPQLRSWDEAAAAKALGLRYEQIPISSVEPNLASIRQALSVIKQANGRHLLIHCDNSQRALALWAIYLFEIRELDPDQAIAQAELAGLKDPNLKSFVKAYVDPASS